MVLSALESNSKENNLLLMLIDSLGITVATGNTTGGSLLTEITNRGPFPLSKLSWVLWSLLSLSNIISTVGACNSSFSGIFPRTRIGRLGASGSRNTKWKQSGNYFWTVFCFNKYVSKNDTQMFFCRALFGNSSL